MSSNTRGCLQSCHGVIQCTCTSRGQRSAAKDFINNNSVCGECWLFMMCVQLNEIVEHRCYYSSYKWLLLEQFQANYERFIYQLNDKMTAWYRTCWVVRYAWIGFYIDKWTVTVGPWLLVWVVYLLEQEIKSEDVVITSLTKTAWLASESVRIWISEDIRKVVIL